MNEELVVSVVANGFVVKEFGPGADFKAEQTQVAVDAAGLVAVVATWADGVLSRAEGVSGESDDERQA